MKVQVQADADLNEIIVKAALRREPGLDFRTAQAAGLPGLNDRDVLALAARSGRLLVTHDRKTMPKHFAEFIATETSAGVSRTCVQRRLSPSTVPLPPVTIGHVLAPQPPRALLRSATGRFAAASSTVHGLKVTRMQKTLSPPSWASPRTRTAHSYRH